jgi:transcriptional regulator with XRE-family HTH domain
MEISTEYDITPDAIRVIRNQTGLSQRAFWGALGLSQSAGSLYEKGVQALPSPTRTLLFLMYVIGLEFDTRTAEGAAALHQLARMQQARARIADALDLLHQALNP